MADDGMLVNFAIHDAPINLLPKFKGGRWKDRLAAKKQALGQQQGNDRETWKKAADCSTKRARQEVIEKQTESRGDFPDPRPKKRRREHEDFTPATSQAQSGKGTHVPGAKPREVISSLFSYNPAPSALQNAPQNDTEKEAARPSNAPLMDGIDTFTSLGLAPAIATHLLTKMDLKTPTAIQKSSIMQLLKDNSDAFIQSETGSGKTLAYLLPLLQRIMALSEQESIGSPTANKNHAVHRDSGLFAVILAPTRELCKQIAVVLDHLLGCARWIVAGTVIGGEKKKSEKARLRKGLNILVATPGRLADHLDNTRVMDVRNVRWLVLDEGDRLMDLGFEEEIQKIVKKIDDRQRKSDILGLPSKRTTILCSATMKMNVQRLGEISLKDAILIKPDTTSDESVEEPNVKMPSETTFYAPAQLRQSYTVVAAKLRLVTLTALLKRTFTRRGSVMKAIVFLSCADSVDFHFKVFTRHTNTEEADSSSLSLADPSPTHPSPLLSTSTNPLVSKLHGSLPQAVRTSIVQSFSKSTRPSLLLATDVASRGLDLPNLDLVIEYDPAFNSDDHLHRIGRTARLGRGGRAIIFLLPGSEEGYVEVLQSSYRNAIEGTRAVAHMPVDDILRKGFLPTSGIVSAPSEYESKATEFQLEMERWVLSDKRNGDIAKRAFQSHVRAYATHVREERKWFDISELHLGHLAKAFGLRARPGKMDVQGLRGKGGKRAPNGLKREGRSRSWAEGAEARDKDDEIETRGDGDNGAKKMKEKIKAQRKAMTGTGADEFNIA